MEVAIKKVGKREGHERFVLVNTKTREVITVRDVSESALRRFFQQRQVADEVVEKCLDRARQRYAESTKSAKSEPVDDAADTMGEDDLLFQLGLDDDTAS